MSERPIGVPRQGFTLIELLVVIAIIGVLVGLILPAVQAAREATRRTGCQNNLRQHGLAINNYVTSLDAFPIGYIAWSNPPGGAAPGWSWAAAILPQVEQGSIYNAANINLAIDSPSNSTVRTTTLSLYVCPSDRDTGAFVVTSRVVAGPVEARTISYAANAGADGSSQSSGNVNGNGLFRMNKSTRPKDVKDG
ncbi:DUF1559 family PulG-like putative transporter, partial [Singulisphaera rosea]